MSQPSFWRQIASNVVVEVAKVLVVALQIVVHHHDGLVRMQIRQVEPVIGGNENVVGLDVTMSKTWHGVDLLQRA